MSSESQPNWREHGIKIVASAQLDLHTPQTPGMTRAAAITHTRTGASKLWAGTVTIDANAKTGAHHHGELESVIHVVSAERACAGANTWSLSPRPRPVILFSFRRLCPIKRSTQAKPRHSVACSCAAVKIPSSLTWISSRSRRRKKSTGFIRCTRIRQNLSIEPTVSALLADNIGCELWPPWRRVEDPESPRRHFAATRSLRRTDE